MEEQQVEVISKITNQKPEVVRTLLDDGWSFRWSSKGNWSWEL